MFKSLFLLLYYFTYDITQIGLIAWYYILDYKSNFTIFLVVGLEYDLIKSSEILPMDLDEVGIVWNWYLLKVHTKEIEQKGMPFDHGFGYSFLLFSFLLKKRQKRKRERRSKNRDQKSCLSARSTKVYKYNVIYFKIIRISISI